MTHTSQPFGKDPNDGVFPLGPVENAAVDSNYSAGARAAIVNRTHRVVRERAQQMKKQQSSARGLVIPLLICSVLLLMMSYALWTVLSSGGASIGELQEKAGKLLGVHAMDTDGPLSVLFFWFLPVSAVALGTVLFRRSRGHGDGEVTR
jgi:ABC-type Na+ efflux pump permease subunit